MPCFNEDKAFDAAQALMQITAVVNKEWTDMMGKTKLSEMKIKEIDKKTDYIFSILNDCTIERALYVLGKMKQVIEYHGIRKVNEFKVSEIGIPSLE